MRCTLVIVAACAVAGALCAPATRANFEVDAQNALADSEHLQFVSDPSQEAAESVTTSDEAELSFQKQLLQRITAIKQAIISTTVELTNVIWQEARSKTEKITENLPIAKRKLWKQLKDLKRALDVKLRELMIPSDDVPVSYAVALDVSGQTIQSLRAQLSDALAVVSEWRNLLSESGREKIAAAKKTIDEVTREIADLLREWKKNRNALKDSASSSDDSNNYAFDPHSNDRFVLMLRDLLEELMQQFEVKVAQLPNPAVEIAQQDFLGHVEEVSRQLESSLKNIDAALDDVQLYQNKTNDALLDTFFTLRRLLTERLQDIENVMAASSDAEAIEYLATQIADIRQRITVTLQRIFHKP